MKDNIVSSKIRQRIEVEKQLSEFLLCDFDFIDGNDNILPRSVSIIDYIQDGTVLVKGARMIKKYRKKFKKEYIGQFADPQHNSVIFNLKWGNKKLV